MTTLAHSRLALPLLAALVAAVACGQNGSGNSDAASGGASGTGAAASSGGADGSGGALASGGTSPTGGGTTGSGGASETGGEGGDGPSGGTSAVGCAGPAGATGVQELSVEVAELTRTFVLSVPESYAAGTPLPLVFAWHGLGGSGSLARLYFGVEQAAAGAAIFVYPDGLPVESSDDQPGWDLADDGIDVAFFDRLLEEVSTQYCVDSERIFSIGHSFGGYMTNRLGCSRAEVLRGVGPVAGGPHFGGSPEQCDSPLAAFITHGTLDETVLLEQGQQARDDYLERSGCEATSTPVSPEPCVLYDGCADGDPVVWCEHDTPAADAHGWPDFVAEGLWDFLSSLP